MMNHKTFEIPETFYCPITKQIMFDPVVTTEMGVDDHTYEREAIGAI